MTVLDHALGMTVRDAEEADVAALSAIKGNASEALHRDRLRDARDSHLRYLVLTDNREIIAFACLVFRRPSYWSDADDPRYLPQIVDLRVKDSHQGRGYGSAFVCAIERIAASAGYGQLYLAVDPVSNPRAHALYRRLGYQQLQSEPRRDRWEFQDSTGQVHRGVGWAVDLVKQLSVSQVEIEKVGDVPQPADQA
jgi:GNAT superfamily N-acetyltransferase